MLSVILVFFPYTDGTFACDNFAKQEAFEKCWAHSPREPPHAHSAGVATGTVARRLCIDVHDDNAWQGDRYGPMEWPQQWHQWSALSRQTALLPNYLMIMAGHTLLQYCNDVMHFLLLYHRAADITPGL